MATTGLRFDRDKFIELILYIAQRCETDPRFGGTKLNKLLFYADFLAYRDYGHPITGAGYQKLQFGPAAIPLLPIQQELIERGDLVVRADQYGAYTQNKPIALRGADLSAFSGREIALVDRVIQALWSLNASEVRDLSHELPGWQVARLKEEIPYETAFVESIDLVEPAA